MRELTIPCEDGDIVIQINDDGVTTRCADLAKLDADLAAIDSGKLDYPLNDTTDYSSCAWETPRGKMIGELFARVDAGEEI